MQNILTRLGVRCDAFGENDLSNGYILGLNGLPAYQDKVYMRCNLGYVLPSNEKDYLTCTASGKYDRPVPSCISKLIITR